MWHVKKKKAPVKFYLWLWEFFLKSTFKAFLMAEGKNNRCVGNGALKTHS